MVGSKPDAPDLDRALESGWSEPPPAQQAAPRPVASPPRPAGEGAPLEPAPIVAVTSSRGQPAPSAGAIVDSEPAPERVSADPVSLPPVGTEMESDGVTVRRDNSAFVAAMEATRTPAHAVAGGGLAAPPAPVPHSGTGTLVMAPPAPSAGPWVNGAWGGASAASPTVLLRGKLPDPTWLALAFGAGLLIGLVAATVVAVLFAPRRHVELPTVSSGRVTTVASEVASAHASPTLADRAAAGDLAALREIAQRPETERTIEESVAAIEGRHVAARLRVTALAARLRARPDAIEAPDIRRDVWTLLNDARTATMTLGLVAELPGPTGPDLLFRIWTSTSARTDSTELAEMLLFSRTIRARASPSLAVALDLRRTTDCEAVRALLPRATDLGDSRVTRPLSLLGAKTGCGPAKKDDCFACLREDPTVLEAAVQASRGRAPPKFP